MEPKKENKKFSVGLFIAIIFLVGALAALGFFGYKFYQQDRADRAQWAASYADRATPVPTSAVTPKETAAADAEDTEGTAGTSASNGTSTAASAAAKTKTPTPTPTPEPTPEVELMPTDNLQSLFACLIRGSDGTVLLDKNADQRMYPASMAKVMTTIVCLENLTDLTEKITVYPEDIDPAFLAEASMAGFEPYEEVTALDLLFGVMLPSGAEACSALATKVAGSEEAFVKMMNDKAVEIGLIGTHYTNPSGLHDENQYTTCHDMTLLFGYAMKNTDFRNIVMTSVYTCTPTEQHPEGLQFTSTVYDGLGVTTFANGAIIEGGKTGTTEEAGKCLVSGAAYYGEEYFLCTAMAPLDSNGNFDDAAIIFSELTR